MNLTVLDGVFAILLIVAGVIGFKKGFFDLITPPIKLIASVCITFLLAGALIDSWTGPLFRGLIGDSIAQTLSTNYPELSALNAGETVPVMFKILAFFAGVNIEQTALSEEGTVAEAIGLAIGTPIGSFVAMLVTYLTLFVVVSLVLRFALGVVGTVLTAGPLNALDKMLGILFTFAICSIACCIIATITMSFSPEFDGGFLFDFFLSLNPFIVT